MCQSVVMVKDLLHRLTVTCGIDKAKVKCAHHWITFLHIGCVKLLK